MAESLEKTHYKKEYKMKLVLYLIPLSYILYKSYKDRKIFYLIFLPLFVLSFLGTTDIFVNLGFSFQFSALLIFFLLTFLLFYFFYKEYKSIKLDILHEKRTQRNLARQIQSVEPSRKQKIIIEDLRTKEKKVYWASPSIKERYKKED